MHEIVALVAQAAARERAPLPRSRDFLRCENEVEHESEPGSLADADELCLLAYQTLLGSNGTLADRPRAALIMQQAADLGSIQACEAAGELLIRGEHGIPRDLRKAHTYLSKAIDAGSIRSHAARAELYLLNGQTADEGHYWRLFFTQAAQELLSLSPEGPEYHRRGNDAGATGRIYCGLVYSRRLDDTVDNISFQVVAPFIESSYRAMRRVWENCAPVVRRKLDVKLDLEMRFLRSKSSSVRSI